MTTGKLSPFLCLHGQHMRDVMQNTDSA